MGQRIKAGWQVDNRLIEQYEESLRNTLNGRVGEIAWW